MNGKKLLNIIITILCISTFPLTTIINNKQHEKFYVINGEDASYDDYPFFARMFWTEKENSEGKEFTGGATLIHPQWVITASHTMEENLWDKDKLPWLHFGPNEHNPTERNTPSYTIKAQKIYRYQEISIRDVDLTKFVDLSLIKLEKPIHTIKPISLIKPGEFEIAGKATVIGHGEPEIGKRYNKKLQKADLIYFDKSIIDMNIIEVKNLNLFKEKIFNPNADIFAGDLWKSFYRGASSGDSGGPLFIKTKHDNNYKLIGVTKGGNPTYPPEQPAVFVGVNYFYYWIMDIINNN